MKAEGGLLKSEVGRLWSVASWPKADVLSQMTEVG